MSNVPFPTGAPEQDALHCVFHPQRETLLRCNRCERPICNQCAVLTPTGYRCKECVRGQQKVFDTARPLDYVLAVAIAFVLALIGSLVAGVMGFFVIFIGPLAGVIIVEAVRLATRRRRADLLTNLTVGAAVLGCLPPLVWSLLTGGLLGILWQGLGLFLIATTIYTRMKGIRLN